jgi:hypothetical protein
MTWINYVDYCYYDDFCGCLVGRVIPRRGEWGAAKVSLSN